MNSRVLLTSPNSSEQKELLAAHVEFECMYHNTRAIELMQKSAILHIKDRDLTVSFAYEEILAIMRDRHGTHSSSGFSAISSEPFARFCPEGTDLAIKTGSEEQVAVSVKSDDNDGSFVRLDSERLHLYICYHRSV